MPRPAGSTNKNNGAAPATVAAQLKKEIEILKATVERLGAGLYDAHEQLRAAAKKHNDPDMAYSAGSMRGFLQNNGLFEQFERQAMATKLERSLDSEHDSAPEDDDETEAREPVTSLLSSQRR